MLKIAFPQMADYAMVAKYFLSKTTKLQFIEAPKITNRTTELGSRYSPEFVCTPFKYTLGTYIECLEQGADILLQFGGGCRYGYYFELQEEILKNLGYNFIYINLASKGKTSFFKMYKQVKKIEPKFNLLKAIYYLFISIKMVKYMDSIDKYIRENIGFEQEKGSFLKMKQKMLVDFTSTKSYFNLYRMYKKYQKEFKNIQINNNKKLKVGIIGELYTVMEPAANYDLEIELASYGISIKRYTNVYYLLFQKKYKVKKYLKSASRYIKYRLGADAADNVGRCKWLCEHNYDGIIHIKSSFCTPEIGIMPIINRICKEYNVPIIYFSFDTNTSKVGMKTRCEAFFDMIEMRNNNE